MIPAVVGIILTTLVLHIKSLIEYNEDDDTILEMTALTRSSIHNMFSVPNSQYGSTVSGPKLRRCRVGRLHSQVRNNKDATSR